MDSNKWIIKGVSGSWVMNEGEVVEVVGQEVVDQIKEEAKINPQRRANRKVNGRKVECTIINLKF